MSAPAVHRLSALTDLLEHFVFPQVAHDGFSLTYVSPKDIPMDLAI